MPFLTVDSENSTDIRLHYEDHGSGNPIFLIHGYPFSGTAWEKQEARFLNEGYRVITYDRRGFGLSSKPSTGYDYDTFARDLDAIIRELDLAEVTLVGHSMGSGEITRYLGLFGSERVAQAVLVSPIPPFLLKTSDNPKGVEQKVFDGFKEAIKKDRYAFITQFLTNFYGLGETKVSEEKLRADFNLAANSSPIAFYKCVDTWLTDFRGDLASFDVPCLIIHGDDDKILPFDVTAKILAEEISARLKVISGGSHGIPWTHGDEISEEILKFISDNESKKLSDRPDEEASFH
jgi:non-heme chloroperoxidase